MNEKKNLSIKETFDYLSQITFRQIVDNIITNDLLVDGKLEWREVLQNFWHTFKSLCDETVGKSNREIIDVIDKALGPHFFPPNGDDKARKCPTCNNGRLGLKVGKFGGFIGCSNYPDCKYTVQFNQLNDMKNGKLFTFFYQLPF